MDSNTESVSQLLKVVERDVPALPLDVRHESMV
jgi:hypothetical protein